ncbi:hypothetical protein M9H77_03343 [Catharanthus roseus]|uniref:Uncharacterized protein n=1 Tax=Catharanthus roseus TaxID=4058 RepID=A0ACC0CB09_CATRO|nr:hypothetical protein M9H77_03343 [Catharanthus roseus]
MEVMEELISVEQVFLDAILSSLEKVERDENEISEERKEGTMKEKENKRKRIGGKLHHNHKEKSTSFSSNSLPLSIGFSFKELNLPFKEFFEEAGFEEENGFYHWVTIGYCMITDTHECFEESKPRDGVRRMVELETN